jgi:uncharacterized phage infection (PIP) family protein YhgE
MSTQVDKAVS